MSNLFNHFLLVDEWLLQMELIKPAEK